MSKIIFLAIDPNYIDPSTEKPSMTPLVSVLTRLSAKPVAVTLALRIGSLRKLIFEKQKEIIEQRARLVELYAQKDEDGKPVMVGDDQIKVTADFFEHERELMRQTFDAKPIRASELVNLTDLCGNDLLALGDLLIDDLTEHENSDTKPQNGVPTNGAVSPNGTNGASGSKRSRRRRKRSAQPA